MSGKLRLTLCALIAVLVTGCLIPVPVPFPGWDDGHHGRWHHDHGRHWH